MKAARSALYAAVSAPALPLAAMTLPLTIFLPQFYADEIGINMTVVGLVFSLIRISDLLLDPLVGTLIDHTRSRWGPYKPWLVLGMPVIMIGAYLLFMAQPGATATYLIVALVVAYAGYSIVTLSQMGLAASVTQRYEERSSMFAWWQLFNMTGVVAALVGSSVYHRFFPNAELTNVAAMGWLVLLMAPVTIAVSLLAKRPAHKQPQSTQHAISLTTFVALFKLRSARLLLASVMLSQLAMGVSSAVFVFFFNKIKGIDADHFTALLAMSFLIMIPMGQVWAKIGNKLGKHRALALGCVLQSVLFTFSLLMPAGSLPYMAATMFGTGLVCSVFDVTPRAMMADVADEERLVSGRDRTGTLFALLAVMYKFGQAIAIGLVFSILDMLGFDPSRGLGNPAMALNAATMSYCVAPALLMLAAAYIASRYPLTAARHDEIRRRLVAQPIGRFSSDDGAVLAPSLLRSD